MTQLDQIRSLPRVSTNRLYRDAGRNGSGIGRLVTDPPVNLTNARRSYVNAIAAHVRGHVAAVKCAACSDDCGWFADCVVLPGFFDGQCTNCFYQSAGSSRCTHRAQAQPAVAVAAAAFAPVALGPVPALAPVAPPAPVAAPALVAPALVAAPVVVAPAVPVAAAPVAAPALAPPGQAFLAGAVNPAAVSAPGLSSAALDAAWTRFHQAHQRLTDAQGRRVARCLELERSPAWPGGRQQLLDRVGREKLPDEVYDAEWDSWVEEMLPVIQDTATMAEDERMSDADLLLVLDAAVDIIAERVGVVVATINIFNSALEQ